MKKGIFLLLIIISLSLFNCAPPDNPIGADLDGDGIADSEDPDIDGDGLSNEDELLFHTDAWKADTDGDGWDDKIEALSAGENGFNPLIANFPKIKIQLAQCPTVSMNYQVEGSQTESVSNAETVGSTLSESDSNSRTHTTSMEHGWEFGVTYSTEASILPKGKLEVAASGHGSYGSEDSYSYSKEQSVEHFEQYEKVSSAEKSSGFSADGGTISVPLYIKNEGMIAYTITNLILTAYILDYADADNPITSIGTLTLGSGSSELGTIQPGQKAGMFHFEKNDLSLDLVKKIFAKSQGICVDTASYTITMTSGGETCDFTAAGTNISALTAKIVVDYGPSNKQDNEEYNVATLTKYNINHTGLSDLYHPTYLSEVLADYIGIPYEISGGGLKKIRDVESSIEKKTMWNIIHTRKRNNVEETVIYPTKDNLDLSTIEVRAGDTLEIIFCEDKDEDGLSARLETFYGTDDFKPDTDGDGLSDLKEVQGWDNGAGDRYTSNPLIVDTDNDGDNDALECGNHTNPREKPNQFGDFIGEITMSSRSANTVTFSWNADSDVTQFWLYRNGAGRQIVSGYSYTWTGLTPNTKYAFSFVGTDGGGDDTEIKTAVKTYDVWTYPAAVTSLNAVNSESDGNVYIDLSWHNGNNNTAGSTLTNYLQVSKDGPNSGFLDGGHFGYNESGTASHLYSGSILLKPVTTYWLKIVTVSSVSGLQADSGPVSCKTGGWAIMYAAPNQQSGIAQYSLGGHGLGGWTNEVSSIKVAEGCSLLGFSHGNYNRDTGSGLVIGPFKGPVSRNLGYMNDDIDSFWVAETAQLLSVMETIDNKDYDGYITVFDEFVGENPDYSSAFRYIPYKYGVTYQLDDYSRTSDDNWSNCIELVILPPHIEITADKNSDGTPDDYVVNNTGTEDKIIKLTSGQGTDDWDAFVVQRK